MEQKMCGKCSCVQKNVWEINLDDMTIDAQISREYNNKRLPAVGDNVYMHKDSYGNYLIDDVFNVKNELFRINKGKKQVFASNIDIVFVVSSMNNEFNVGKIERFMIIGDIPNAKRVIILSKKDLCSAPELFVEVVKSRFPNTEVIVTNALEGDGIEQVKNVWGRGEAAIFIGSSGVGKSTLINALANESIMKTGAIREKDDKGRHTTTTRNLFVLRDGRIVIDTPGVRSIGVSIDENQDGIQEVFERIIEIEKQCRFANCTHKNPKGCAILKAIEDGTIDKSEYERYVKFKKKEASRREIQQEDNDLPEWKKIQSTKERKKHSRNRF